MTTTNVKIPKAMIVLADQMKETQKSERKSTPTSV